MNEQVSQQPATPPRNEPIHSDGRVTEQSMEKRIEEKFFKPRPAPAAPAPEPAAPAPQAAPQAEQATQSAPAEGEQTPAEEHYEFEFSGSRYQVPKELKELHEGYLRHEDYTKKTMGVSEKERVLGLQLEQFRQATALQQSLQPKYETLNGITGKIAQYEQIDWNAWIAQDHIAAQKGMLELQLLRDHKTKAQTELQQAAETQMRAISNTVAKLRDENMKSLQGTLKGWNADSQKDLYTFIGKTYGFSDQETAQIYDARAVRMMKDAMEWRKLQESKPQALKAAQAAKTVMPNAAQAQSAKAAKEGEMKRAIKAAKTEPERQKAIARLLESRL